jgi:hypothetical protein
MKARSHETTHTGSQQEKSRRQGADLAIPPACSKHSQGHTHNHHAGQQLSQAEAWRRPNTFVVHAQNTFAYRATFASELTIRSAAASPLRMQNGIPTPR